MWSRVETPSRPGGPRRWVHPLTGGGWGDLTLMISKPLGTLGLWTVNEPRDGPGVRSQDTFPLPQQHPSHPEMSEHHHRTDTPRAGSPGPLALTGAAIEILS